MWGLPLQFHFVGLWLAVHRVRDPTVLSAWGSVGGSTKAQLGPVLSCGSCWPAGRTAGSGPDSLRMPTQHARKTKAEWTEKLGMEAQTAEASWSLSPREDEAAASGRMGSTHLPLSSRAVFQGLQVSGLPCLVPASLLCSTVHPMAAASLGSSPFLCLCLGTGGELLQRNFCFTFAGVRQALSPPQCP